MNQTLQNPLPTGGFATGFGNRKAGFSLPEILVSISIIAVLAVLSMTGIGRMKLAAAKSTTTNQMRQMSVAIHLWSGDKSSGEPMYFSNGTADYGHESTPGANASLAPGNLARALFNKIDPDNSYLTDPTVFFTPLAKVKPPRTENYAPNLANSGRLWGTYAYYYPLSIGVEMTTRQREAIGAVATSKVGVDAKGKLLLATDYENSVPLFDPIYMALMVDGSVKEVAKTRPAWRKWVFNE
ncbi:MAG: hypothetical protein RLZZ245_52 [Verrucomicrobiota bacterium]